MIGHIALNAAKKIGFQIEPGALEGDILRPQRQGSGKHGANCAGVAQVEETVLKRKLWNGSLIIAGFRLGGKSAFRLSSGGSG